MKRSELESCHALSTQSSYPIQRNVVPPRTIKRHSHQVSRYFELDLPDTQNSSVRAVQPRTPQPRAPSLQLFGGNSRDKRSSRRSTSDVVKDQEATKRGFTTVIDTRNGRYEEVQHLTKHELSVRRSKKELPRRPEPPKRAPIKPLRPPPPKPRQQITSPNTLTPPNVESEYDYVDPTKPRGLLWSMRKECVHPDTDSQDEEVYKTLEQSTRSEDNVYAVPTAQEDPDEDHDYANPDEFVYYNFQDPSFGSDYASLDNQTIQDAPLYQEIVPVHTPTSSLPVQ